MSDELVGLGPHALGARRARVALGTVALLAIGFGLVAVLRRWDVTVPAWMPVVAVGLGAVFSWWWAAVDHARWSWRLTEDLLEVRRGVVVRRVYLVPRNRIQNVTTKTGPLQSRYGILDLAVHTAGARTRSVVIEDLDAGHAAAIRRRLGLQ